MKSSASGQAWLKSSGLPNLGLKRGPEHWIAFLVAGVLLTRLLTGAIISFDFNEIAGRGDDLVRFRRDR